MINNNLTEFNEGGTHSENKHGGIPQGQSSNGSMNTVEQGETKKGNFVYSDRLYINEDLAKANNLPGYIKGKSFASASKAINDKFKDRNDIHTKATQKELLDRLAQSQEQLKAEQEAINQSMQINQSEVDYPEETQQFKTGGPMGILGGGENGILGGTSFEQDSPDNSMSKYNGSLSQSSPFGDFISKNKGSLGNAAGMLGASLYGQDSKKEGTLNTLNSITDSIGGPVGQYGRVATGAYDAGSELFGKSDVDTSGNTVLQGVDTGKAAAKGALKGAQAGMAFGPLGAGVGAAIGGVAGLVGGNKDKKAVAKNNEIFFRKDNFYKYQFNENNDDTKVFAEGGDLGIDPPVKTNFIPTKQDSLNVLNRSIENEKAYLDKGYKLTNSYPLKGDVYNGMNKNYNTFVDKSKRNQPSNIIQNGKVVSNILNPSEYKRDLGNGLFEGRDLNNNYLNLDVKPSLYHQNIKPITQKVYTSADGNDIVNIPSYNSPIFTESLNKPVENKIQPINTQPITLSTTPIVKQPATILPVKKQTVNKVVNPVTDTLQKQNYGLSDIQKFKTIKHAQSNMLPAKKGNPEFQSFIKDRTNQKAYGGNLDGGDPQDTFPNGIYQAPVVTDQEYLLNNKGKYNPNIIKDIQSRTGAFVDGDAGKETYVKSGLRHDGTMWNPNLNADRALESALSTPDSEVKPDYTLDDIKNMESSYNANNQSVVDKNGKKIDYSKYKDAATNALRYAPILGNILQKNKIGPAEVENAIKNSYQYKKQYIDEAAYRNAADQQAALSMEALNKSGLSGNQLLAGTLGSQLQRTKGVAEGAMAAKMHNLNENKIAEQVKQQNEGDYIADVRRINDINAQNRANRDTQMSKFDSEIANSLGAIGKEETFKKMAEKITGYDWMGKYLKANPNATPSEVKAAHDKEQEDKGKESKKYFENLPEFSDKIDYKTPGIVQNKKGGMMNLKFKKY